MKTKRKQKQRSVSVPITHDDYIVWREHFAEPHHESFEPVEIDPHALPEFIQEFYEDKGAEVLSVMAYPGPKRQLYGRPRKPLVYLIVKSDDGATDYWAELPDPSLRGASPFWQRDRNLRPYRPWQW